MGVSKNRGTTKSSILIGFSIIFTIHFGVPLFLEIPMYISLLESSRISNPQMKSPGVEMKSPGDHGDASQNMYEYVPSL